MKKEKFKNVFKNQTEIGKLFGISAIAIGKKLMEYGLKDKNGATTKALEEGYAVSTPLKDGTPYFMWNVNKVKFLLSTNIQLISEEDIWVNEVKQRILNANALFEENDKLAYMVLDEIYDDIPAHILNKIKYKAEFDLSLKEFKSVEESILNMLDTNINTKELKLFQNMIERYYPQYLERLKTYIAFS